MKLYVLLLLCAFSIKSYSQQHIFLVTKKLYSLDGEMNYIDSKDLSLKVKSLGNGKYDVGTKDETIDYFVFVTVKFSHIDKDVYIYDVISYDTEFKRVRHIGTNEKLSDMTSGMKGDVIFFIDNKNYIYFSTLYIH